MDYKLYPPPVGWVELKRYPTEENPVETLHATSLQGGTPPTLRKGRPESIRVDKIVDLCKRVAPTGELETG